MSKSYEENTKDFYNELNGECDPERLLYIANQGIFLDEPLFKHEKIKNHEYVVDINILSRQFYMINNDSQYNRFKYWCERINNNEIDLLNDLNYFDSYTEYYSLIIINKYFIDRLLKEKNVEFIINIIKYKNPNFYLFYLYNTYICTSLLDDIISSNKNYDLDFIVEKIILYFGRDKNILQYCLDLKKKNNLVIIPDLSNYKLPLLNHTLKYVKYYSTNLYNINSMQFICNDNKISDFINIIFSEEGIRTFEKPLYSQRDKEIFIKYNINLKNVSNYKIINNNENILKSEEIINNNKNITENKEVPIEERYFKYNTKNILILFYNIHNYGNEELAALALACADKDGNIAVNSLIDVVIDKNTNAFDRVFEIFPRLRDEYNRVYYNCFNNINVQYMYIHPFYGVDFNLVSQYADSDK
ncbi:hypothetical protein U3516DRAFT_854813 [Neocallimastix sp. 'constans']